MGHPAVIAGGGPTGVEIAGMLAEMGHSIRLKEYPEITDLEGHIHLIDASPTLLGPMSKKAQTEATKVLGKLGVHIITNVAVKDYVNGEVLLANGDKINTNMLIWTSGVTGRELPGLPADVIGRGKRVLVDEFNKVKSVTVCVCLPVPSGRIISIAALNELLFVLEEASVALGKLALHTPASTQSIVPLLS